MSIAKYADPARAADPRNAVKHFSQGGVTPNMTPALLWLWVLLVGVSSLRAGQLPNRAQLVTWVFVAGAVVGAGAIFPTEVALALVALVVAAALNIVGPLTKGLDWMTGKVANLGA